MTPEEKRKILQQRRQAKMAGGKATDRLNNILNQGSSVKTATTSVLDKSPTPEPTSTSTPPANIPAHLKVHEDDDPDTSDIEQLLSHRASPQPAEADFDKMFSSMFGGAGGEGSEDPFSSMMMNMMKQQQQSEGENPANLQDMEYEQNVLKYNTYKSKQLKFKFLIIRYLSIIMNFAYHFIYNETFRSSSHNYIRSEIPTSNQFTLIFLSIESVILSSYYLISSRRKSSENMTSDNFILKMISMASSFVPMIASYQPLLVSLLGYWEILNMFLGDLALIVVLFGITSYLK